MFHAMRVMDMLGDGVIVVLVATVRRLASTCSFAGHSGFGGAS